MGYIRHHAIVVTSWNAGLLSAAHAEAERLCKTTTPIVEGTANQQTSFAVLPDGSKEGWPESDNGDASRDSLVEWIEAQCYDDGSSSALSWVEVEFPGDEPGPRITRSSWAEDDEP